MQATVIDTLKRYWGYESFLPGQQAAVDAVMQRQDSLVIFPTGGGKSLTYQLPALQLAGTAVVVSPLIALMKDQVDNLVGSGVAAATLNSSVETADYVRAMRLLRNGELKLLYVSPERLLTDDTVDLLHQVGVSFFAIDEAHCISHWGHDFRPGYRALAQLRDLFPEVPMHACTATATLQVREDIVRTLRLKQPTVLVGSFDRPNLTYRVVPRHSLLRQVREVMGRHADEAGIIYCIRKADVDELCQQLRGLGCRAVPYHAGLSGEQRRQHQEAFINERADVVVATVAFGMGIDRSDVRYVIHTGMPKSIEHYQQEAGRAGRDGLAAECVLFYSGQDPIVWRTILGEPVSEADRTAHAKLREMYGFCRSLLCRHRYLVSYFSQPYHRDGCGACDQCLGETSILGDSFTVARKILSCVARVGQRFGIKHVAEVLKGSKGGRLVEFGHDKLSTYGLLKQYDLKDIADWVDQLIAGGFLRRDGEYPVVRLTEQGAELLRGQGEVALTQPTRRADVERPTQPHVAADGQLFEALRALRRQLAVDRGVPPYIIFGDATLRELAALRPTTESAFRNIKGVGESKARTLGPVFLDAIRQHVAGNRGDAIEISPR